jgi:hypothetical protein
VIQHAGRMVEPKTPNGASGLAGRVSKGTSDVGHASEAEISVLGAMMIGGRETVAEVFADLRPAHFADERHGRICAAAYMIYERGDEPDPTSIVEELRAVNELESVGGILYLVELLDSVATASQIGQHADYVIAGARRRALVESLSQAHQSACQGIELAEVISTTRTKLDELGRGARRNGRPPVLSGEELFSRDISPASWIIDSLIPRGRQGTVFGAPGVAKSMVMRILAGGIATGSQQVLGRFAAARGPFLWVTAEEDEDELRRGFAITAAGSGYDIEVVKDQLHVLALRGTEFSLRAPADRAWLEEHIKNIKPLLVILDSVASLSGVDLKNDQEVLPIMLWGAGVATLHGTTSVWIAHDRKGKPGEASANDLDDVFGSRVVTSQLDFAFRLVRSGGDRILRCAKLRGATEPPDLTLGVTVIPDQEFGMRCRTNPSGASRDADMAMAIRTHLEASAGATMSDLRDTVAAHVAARAHDVGQMVRTLIREGKIINKGTERCFSLHWATPGVCPAVSAVSGHDAGEACPVSPP